VIDVSTFKAALPAGTYAVGDVVPLVLNDGPSVVRSGRGAAYLKRISSFMITDASGSVTSWRVFVKNSDWIDPAASIAIPMANPTAMDMRSGAIQRGHDCPLTQNSSWEVWAECVSGATTTGANGITAEIEIDYPSVSSIIDPTTLPGIPCSITHDVAALPVGGQGDIMTADWEVFNVDFFKAGYEYALEKVELVADGANVCGYIALSNAAGMGGLTRIIPISSARANIRPPVDYASKLVKGPMDIKYKLFNTAGSSTTTSVKLILDFVKRRI